MKVTSYIASFLSGSGIDTVFGQIGGFNADLIDAIGLNAGQAFVLGYHEQASGFAANAFAMVRENLGVATSSGAPSSCNLLPGIANAFFDSVPCLFITGSVHTRARRQSPEIRQNAFEEIDMVSMVSGITKYATLVTDPQGIRYCMEKALYLALEGRKGPVLIDLPYDVARSEVQVEALRGFTPPPGTEIRSLPVREIVGALAQAKRPVLLVGGGCRSAEARQGIRDLLDKAPIPVVASLCGLDVLPHDHPCFVGFIGHYGNRYANFALANSDCLVILGSRLDERQIAGDKSRFAPRARIIRIDIDKIELGRHLNEHISIACSVEHCLAHLLRESFPPLAFEQWHAVIARWKNRFPAHVPDPEVVDANHFLHVLSGYLPDNCVVCADVGQNQMFTAQSLRLRDGVKLLNSSGYGSMGYALPAAIGAAYARPGAIIVSINGDGGLQMNLQELQAVKRDGLPIKIIVLNNNCLGMIRRLQERIFDDRTTGSVQGYEAPDYRAIAHAYGLRYVKIDSAAKYAAVEALMQDPFAALIEVELPQKIMNNPEPGAGIDLQTPLLSDDDNRLIQRDCEF